MSSWVWIAAHTGNNFRVQIRARRDSRGQIYVDLGGAGERAVMMNDSVEIKSSVNLLVDYFHIREQLDNAEVVPEEVIWGDEPW